MTGAGCGALRSHADGPIPLLCASSAAEQPKISAHARELFSITNPQKKDKFDFNSGSVYPNIRHTACQRIAELTSPRRTRFTEPRP
jgi:hypothetical protein